MLASKQYKAVFAQSWGDYQNQGKGNYDKIFKGICLSRPDEKIIDSLNQYNG